MTTQESELGTLKWVDKLRDVWKDEAQDFTPWLARNLDRLSAVFGIELELEGKEVVVGPYRADIVARDPRDNSRVLIENQLEDADLKHLGQVLAYLAGLEAKVVVWIAKVFGEAHLSAIRWLNTHTDDELAFFAVRVRLAQIGNSPPAPVFEVQESPNNWDRWVHNTAPPGQLTKRGQFRRKFWFYVADKQYDDVKPKPGFAGSNYYTYVEDADLRICLYVSKDGVGAYLIGNKNEPEESALPRIQPYLKPLHRALKGDVKLDDKWGNSFLEIDTHNRANWGEMADWLHTRFRIYESVLRVGGELGGESDTP